MHFCFREAPGSLCEPSGEGLGKLCRSLWMELKGSWEASGEAPGVGLGKLCCSLLEGSKGYWEALWEGPEKLWRSLLGRVEGLLGGSCGAGPTAFWESIAWQRVEYATFTWHILSCFEQHPVQGLYATCPLLLEGSEGSGEDSGGLVFVICCNTLGSRGRRNSRTFISPNHDCLENHLIERDTDLEKISSSNILFERSSFAFCPSLTIRSGSRDIASYAVLFEIVLLIPQRKDRRLKR